ncbi:BnaC03g64280D [Brassica napus]|uniref:BnaC03g64280D protein n=1 Tax=Brassica napus TaxID=3708 RepID=A0A078IB99_BRANA|nr:BnaC03g64280D [Brassica napus]
MISLMVGSLVVSGEISMV